MSAGDLVLSVRDVKAGYVDENVLHGVSIDVQRGEVVAVIGPNGSGKSTLLKTIYGLIRPRGGSVVFRAGNGATHDLLGLPPYAITRLGVNFVPQLANVFAEMSVRENLEVGAFVHKGRFEDRLAAVLDTFPPLASDDNEVIELYLGSRGRLGAAVLRLREQHQRIRTEVG